ncbi:YhdP family protein [Microbulbifer halophilus]|uniref:YhdP family protein n=1 Tax=Microbulbifer halophilus TaxID=453963 RepID=A0ABW5EE77_9GAMM|nr:YhdP family protein [Microbulbifer halophilus]MCW8125190.1 YhdP family protein [Microbulbifer halophilus]
MGALRWLARKFWLLAVILVICLAILVQTGRMLSPLVEDYRPQISGWLSERLGVPVQMERLSLRWQALEVALRLDELRLGEGGEVHMGYGLFHLDLLASLWNRELVWKNLQVRDFSAELSRTENGGWHIEGFPPGAETAPEEKGAASGRLGDPARIFQLGPRVQVRNASIRLRLADGESAEMNLPQIQLENAGGFHRLTARAFIAPGVAVGQVTPGQGETLRLVLEGRGNPRDRDDFSLDGYVQLNDLLVDADTIALLHQLTPLPDKYHWRGRKMARGSLWLHSDSDSGYRLRGRLNLAQVAAEAGPEKPDEGEGGEEKAEPSLLGPLRDLSGDLSGRWQPGGSWRLALQNIQLDWRDLPVPPLNLQARSSAQSGLQLAVDSIELGAWSRILERVALLEGPADEWLRALKPSGRLERVQFVRDADGDIALSANLRDLTAAAHRGAPAVQGLNGYLEMRGRDGFLQLDGGDGLRVRFPKLYEDAFEFARAGGTVAWQVDRENNAVEVHSGPLRLTGELGDISGQFLLQLPFIPRTRPAEFTLALGLRDAPVSAQGQLVPFTVGDDLRRWLSDGLGSDNPGRVSRAGFVYRGSHYREGEDPEFLALGDHPERQTVQLTADVTDGALDYAPGWPAARDVDARLLVNDRNVLVNAEAAKLWNIDARDIEVGVTPSPAGDGSLLGVRARLEGPAADGLKLLRESPLRERLGGAFDDWQLDGHINGDLTLSQPLGGAELPKRQSVELDLRGGHLRLDNLRLDIDGLNGRVHYDSDNGLAGTRLNGELWERRLQARIEHIGEGEERDTQVIIDGSNSIDAVQDWSGRPELAWLDGVFDYRALVTIPAPGREKPYSAVFEMTSDLEGVEVDLPAPLGKVADEKSRYVLRVPIGEQGSLFNLSYGEHLQGQFWQVDGVVDRAAIALNAEAGLPQERGLAITGDLSQIDLPRWRELLQVFGEQKNGSDDNGGVAAADLGKSLPIRLDLSTDRLRLGATDIEHIHIRGRGLGPDWRLQFDSEMAAGTVSGVMDGAEPLQMDLSHLQLPAREPPGESPAEGETEADADPWAGFDFTQLPQVDFSTDSLRVGEEDLGRWSFRLQPSASRLVISDIRGAARGVRVKGRGRDNDLGAQLVWRRDEQGTESSQFIGRLLADDLAAVQRAWGQEPAIESESAIFDTALHWDGSPAQVAADQLSGELKIDIRDGRFLRATDSAGSALLRLLSLFNFDTWARRLRLDFSDLYQNGMAFDRVSGEVYFEGDGRLLIAVPIQVEGPTSELQMAGRVNLKREDLNLTLVATLPVGNNLALVAALAGGLPAAAGVYLISKAFKKQVDNMASVSYRISGNWEEPQVRFDKLFDGDGAQRQGSEAEARRQPPPDEESRAPTEVSGSRPERESSAAPAAGGQ